MTVELERIFTGSAIQTPLGAIFIAVSDQGLVAVQIAGGEMTFTQSLAARFGVQLISAEFQVMPILRQIEAYL